MACAVCDKVQMVVAYGIVMCCLGVCVLCILAYLPWNLLRSALSCQP